MKQLLVTFILLALGTTIAGQDKRESVIVQTEIFKVEYNEVLEQPMWVEYTVQCPNGDASRKGLDFWEPKGVHTSDDDDYSNNIWDKGHLAPAAAFNCSKEMLKKTFSYLNCALQHEGLNRGPWRFLEEYERELALENDTVKVSVIVHFDNDTVLPTGAKIPSDFTKIIIVNNDTLTYKFPNKNVRGKKWEEFEVK